jgi:WD40 repeat protein
MDLPAPFIQAAWSPGGEQLALVAADGSIWKFDYPALEKPGRISPPMPDVRDLTWPPDGARLAFVSGVDIYILEARK